MPKCESTVIRNWLTAAEFAGLGQQDTLGRTS